ncbi:hypothetical protein Q3G72_027889 [Acer saccharum]|nr:hypothetical protein Q3G72_027889 [Acer saccharum]
MAAIGAKLASIMSITKQRVLWCRGKPLNHINYVVDFESGLDTAKPTPELVAVTNGGDHEKKGEEEKVESVVVKKKKKKKEKKKEKKKSTAAAGEMKTEKANGKSKGLKRNF